MIKSVSKPQQVSLPFCIAMDAIGFVSFAIPGIGEFSDVIWAPLSAFIFYKTFGGRKAVFGALFNFVEEALPFVDVVPTFTIMWLYRYFSPEKNTIALR